MIICVARAMVRLEFGHDFRNPREWLNLCHMIDAANVSNESFNSKASPANAHRSRTEKRAQLFIVD
jgi:hypothetical protein